MKAILNKISLLTFLFALSLTLLLPTLSFANETNSIPATPKTEIPAEVQVMLDRLEEIKEMDKSELSRTEKRELRKEVRSIKKELRSTGNGVYLSVGAIIIIVLLLILLL